MRSQDHRRLLRLLHGELPEAEVRQLAGRLAREPELARAFRRLQETWEGLELPPPALPPGFAARLTARAQQLAAAQAPGKGVPALTLAPRWVQVAAALALSLGLALGAGIGLWQQAEEAAAAAGWSAEASSLAETYWEAVEEGLEGDPGGLTPAEGAPP